MKNLRPLNSAFDKADFFSRASKVQFSQFEDLFWVWQLAMKERDAQFNEALLEIAKQDFPDMKLFFYTLQAV